MRAAQRIAVAFGAAGVVLQYACGAIVGPVGARIGAAATAAPPQPIADLGRLGQGDVVKAQFLAVEPGAFGSEYRHSYSHRTVQVTQKTPCARNADEKLSLTRMNSAGFNNPVAALMSMQTASRAPRPRRRSRVCQHRVGMPELYHPDRHQRPDQHPPRHLRPI